jgi:hypothetical protein
MRNVCMTFSVLWNGDSSRAAFSLAIRRPRHTRAQ